MSTANKVSILTYHSIDDSGSVISTPPTTFRKQMKYLKEARFQIISLNEIARRLYKKQALPERTIAIVFDDGYQNVYTEAFPLLQEYQFSATTFLITEYCGGHNDWPGNPPDIARQPLLSWSQVKEMQKCGFEFGAHTLTHPDLTGVSIQEARREIVESRKTIEYRLGSEVTQFAYPYGKHNQQITEFARSQFWGACSTNLGEVSDKSDPLLLERIDTYYLSRSMLFRRLQTNALSSYLRCRQTLREVKALSQRRRRIN